MKSLPKTKQEKQEKSEDDKRTPYEAPAVVYEGLISTRAGSPVGSPDGEGDGFDPSDLFGD